MTCDKHFTAIKLCKIINTQIKIIRMFHSKADDVSIEKKSDLYSTQMVFLSTIMLLYLTISRSVKKKEEWNAIIRIDCLSCYVYNWFCNVYLFDWLPSVFNLSSLKCNITKKKEVNVQRDIQKQTWSWLPFENVLRLIFLYRGIPDKIDIHSISKEDFRHI